MEKSAKQSKLEKRQARGPELLGKFVFNVAREYLKDKPFSDVELKLNWEKIAGEEIAKLSIPQKIKYQKGKAGVLYLQVKISSAAPILEFKKKILIEKINTFFGYCIIQDIIIKHR